MNCLNYRQLSLIRQTNDGSTCTKLGQNNIWYLTKFYKDTSHDWAARLLYGVLYVSIRAWKLY